MSLKTQPTVSSVPGQFSPQVCKRAGKCCRESHKCPKRPFAGAWSRAMERQSTPGRFCRCPRSRCVRSRDPLKEKPASGKLGRRLISAQASSQNVSPSVQIGRTWPAARSHCVRWSRHCCHGDVRPCASPKGGTACEGGRVIINSRLWWWPMQRGAEGGLCAGPPAPPPAPAPLWMLRLRDGTLVVQGSALTTGGSLPDS